MPLIHMGASTHHHDQAITPVSLSTISASTPSEYTSWAAFQNRSVVDRGRRTRMLNTLPGYAAVVAVCHDSWP